MAISHSRQIIFMRHGIAARREHYDGSDDLRPLTPKGIKKVQMVIKCLADSFRPDLIVTSDLRRAHETALICAGILSEVAGKRIPLQVLRGKTNVLRPDSHPDSWIALMPRVFNDRDVKKLLVVGHEPHLSELVWIMSNKQSRIHKFKKAGVAMMESTDDFGPWSLSNYLSPRDWKTPSA